GVRQQLDASRRRDAAIEDQVAKTGDIPLHPSRGGDPIVQLAAALDLAAHLEAPDRLPRARNGKAHLRERNAEFGGPPARRLRCPDLPHPVVVVVLACVIEEGDVALDTGRVDAEHIAGLSIVPRVEAEMNEVAWREVVAAAQA